MNSAVIAAIAQAILTQQVFREGVEPIGNYQVGPNTKTFDMRIIRGVEGGFVATRIGENTAPEEVYQPQYPDPWEARVHWYIELAGTKFYLQREED